LPHGRYGTVDELRIKNIIIFNISPDEFLTRWIADRIIEIVKDEKELAGKALKIAEENENINQKPIIKM
jgi:hypothetical protein